MADTEPHNRNHFRGSVLLFAGRIFALFVNFAVQVITVRYLSKSDFGILAFAVSITNLLSVICLLGQDKSISRNLSISVDEQDASRFWGSIIVASAAVIIFSGLACAVCLLLYISGVKLAEMDSNVTAVLAIVSGLVVTETINALFVAFFAALSEAKSIFFRRHVLGPLFKLIAAAAAITAGGSVFLFAAGQLIASLVATAVCFPMLMKVVKTKKQLAWPGVNNLEFPIQKIFAGGLGFLIGDIGFLFRGALIPIFIGFYFLSEDVANYQSVFSLARLNEIVLVTFSILFLPAAASLSYKNESVKLQKLFDSTSVWIILLSFPLFSITFLLADLIPGLVYGEKYGSSGAILKWLATAFFVNASFGTSLRLMRSIGKFQWVILCDVIVISGSLVSVFLLVPNLGAVGAALSVLCSYALQAVVFQLAVGKTTNIRPVTSNVYFPFLVGLGMTVLCDQTVQRWNLSVAATILLCILSIGLFLAFFFRKLSLGETFPELRNLPFLKKTQSI